MPSIQGDKPSQTPGWVHLISLLTLVVPTHYASLHSIGKFPGSKEKLIITLLTMVMRY